MLKINTPKRVLVSWISFGNDFTWTKNIDNKTPVALSINLEGPTFTFHRNYFVSLTYDKHFIFCLEKDFHACEKLVYELERHFQYESVISMISIPVTDAIDSSLLYPLVCNELLKIRGIVTQTRQRNQDKKKHNPVEIEALFSTGTSAMQMTWVFCKFNKLIDKLYQTRRATFITENTQGLVEMTFPATNMPFVTLFKDTKVCDKMFINQIESLKNIYEKAQTIANFDFTVLIYGESGTGKENLANIVHQASCRKKQVFLSINCAALGNELLESRLFGYKKGAFTGAEKDSMGYFEVADGGTIFFDEIGEISPYMQQTLLRVLQEGEYMAVGSSELKKTNVRLIAATNKNLVELCQKGLFRWDLYYRLAVVELELPSFRDFKKSEKKLFLYFFIDEIGKELNLKLQIKPISLSLEVENWLLAYDFPGNIRELKHIIEGFYAHQVGEVLISHLPKRLQFFKQKIDNSENSELIWDWQHHEKKLIEKALLHFRTQGEAAAAIGYKNATYFGKKIREYGIKP